MKPISLKIKGINSYVTEQVVDFEKLSENRLFGVFGETGSGKTTILDAIIIALYGSSEREIMPNMINVNSKTAYIYFTFELEVGGEVKKFVVKRDYKARKSGLKCDALLLDENDMVLAEQPDQVNETILKIIGIGKKEFLKVIALPQGEFDRFLLDTPANRKKTIAKLFNLECFGTDLQEKIKIKKEIVNLEKMNIEDRISMYGEDCEENLEKLRKNLSENQRLLNETQEMLISKKNDFEVLKKDYELNSRLTQLKSQLGILKSEEKEMKELAKQIECTKKYGEYILLHNKEIALSTEISQLTDELLMDKKQLLNNDVRIKELESEVSIASDSYNKLSATLNIMTQNLDKYQSLKASNEILSENKARLEDEVENLSDLLSELKESLIEYKKICDEQERSYEKIAVAINDNDDILNKLRETKTVKTIEGFLDYLAYLKSIVNPDSLQEVYQFDIYKEVNEVIDSVNNYENTSRKEIVALQQDYELLSRYNKDLDKLEQSLVKSNKEYATALNKTKRNIDEAKNKIATCNAKIEEKSVLLSSMKQQLRETKTQIKINEAELATMKDMADYDEIAERCEELSRELNGYTVRKTELINERNEVIVSIEVGTVQLENLKNNFNLLTKQIKSLNLKNINNNEVIDSKMYLDDSKVEECEQKLEKYNNQVKMLTYEMDKVSSEIVNKKVDMDVMAGAMEELRTLEEKEKVYTVNIALCNQLIEQTKEKLTSISQLLNQKEEVKNRMNIVNELNKLTANGKLLDYVSEEYMQLITQFSNKFVYKISQGKYLLKYSGEFYVVDNFNGGISRSVKTLSGGERFIVSLSLALGISQSIAINNNKKFNFFFIDEGFGSLSDEYISMVLSSFDALIKLNFTVGFISHVEKMQGYINNRIVVTKKNNDEGSIIKQFN